MGKVSAGSEVVLVTGGAGYVGSHACRVLRDEGYLPVVFDSLERGFRELVKFGPLEIGNILDAKALQAAFQKHRPSAVLHFAAYAYVGESVKEPQKYQRNNVDGTRSLLDAAEAAGVKKFVFSSSCAVVGIPERIPMNEELSCKPVNPYGQSKLDCEGLLRARKSVASIALRYFNAAGADAGGEIGECHEPETHLIPLALRAAAGTDGFALDVFGDDYETPDGTCVRDYVHVTDLARAHVAALKRLDSPSRKSAFEFFHLGTGRGHSVREVLASVERVTGKKVRHRMAPRRAGDPPGLVADPSRAGLAVDRGGLGWQAQIRDLDAIVEGAWRWYQKRHA